MYRITNTKNGVVCQASDVYDFIYQSENSYLLERYFKEALDEEPVYIWGMQFCPSQLIEKGTTNYRCMYADWEDAYIQECIDNKEIFNGLYTIEEEI